MITKNGYFILEQFKAYELVDRDTFQDHGEESTSFFRPEILIALEELRTAIDKPLVINNWREGGEYSWSGLRTIKCFIGAPYSMHRLGGAFDIKCPTMRPDRMREVIITLKRQGFLKTLTRMEAASGDNSWVHIDCKPTGKSELVVFSP